jgi:hypothetical protein
VEYVITHSGVSACEPLYDLQLIAQDLNSITIGWSLPVDEGLIIQYNKVGEAIYKKDTVLAADLNQQTIVLDNLNANTLYQIYVKQLCGNSVSRFAAPIFARTAAAARESEVALSEALWVLPTIVSREIRTNKAYVRILSLTGKVLYQGVGGRINAEKFTSGVYLLTDGENTVRIVKR